MPQLPRHLPPEIVDYIIDLLGDDLATLEQCCLVSKSFIPRTQRYLFEYIKIEFPSGFEAWKRTFPDLANSPAHHTRSLLLDCKEVFTTEDTEAGGWIRSFTNVVRLEVWNIEKNFDLDPFRVLSSVKSLRLVLPEAFPPSRVVEFICSLPLLEDLDISQEEPEIDDIDECRAIPRHLTLPPLTGTLVLQEDWPEHITHLLLAPSGVLHFRKIVSCVQLPGGLEGVMALVEGCSNTLENLDIEYLAYEGSPTARIDLSNAKKLKEVVFRFKTDIAWITAALNTVAHEHSLLRQISISFPFYADRPTNVRLDFGEETYQEWMDLDNILAQLCESRACRINAVYDQITGGKPMCKYIEGLLPRVVERGLIDAIHFRMAQ